MKRKVNLCILRNELPDDYILWIKTCEENKEDIDYEVVDITKNDWLEKLRGKSFDFYLAKPPGLSSFFKQLYDERILILNKVLNLPIYPTLTEILIYENKRFLASWLKANKLPHPKTDVFYFEDEARDFLKTIRFPIVAKFNIGASGSGVKILHSKSEAESYINSAFGNKGAPKRWGPNLSKGGLIKRGFHYVLNPNDISKKVDLYSKKRKEIQKGFVIFQEFIPHDYEWRVVVIENSYFAHKKLKIGEKASGSTLKKYENPPFYLFDFAKNIMDKFRFYSQAIDLFETPNGKLLINEMQCIFGQSDPYQMLVDGVPGRYRFLNNKWVFEKGNFNKNESYDLRVEHILNLTKEKNKNL